MFTMMAAVAAAAATTSKWLIAGKILTVVGTGLLTAGPVLEEKMKDE